MDCRVKPGNDSWRKCASRMDAPITCAFPQRHAGANPSKVMRTPAPPQSCAGLTRASMMSPVIGAEEDLVAWRVPMDCRVEPRNDSWRGYARHTASFRWLHFLTVPSPRSNPSEVMAGLDPAIHLFLPMSKAWMPGSRPGMTTERYRSPPNHYDDVSYDCMPQRRTVIASMLRKIRFSTARPIRITVSNPANTAGMSSMFLFS